MASVDKSAVEAALKKVQMRQSRFATFKIVTSDDKIQVVVDKISDRNVNYKKFLREFSETQPLYACYDYEHLSPDERPISNLLFFYWVPQNSNTNDRILYSSAKSNLVSLLSGYTQHNVEEKSEIEELIDKEEQIKK